MIERPRRMNRSGGMGVFSNGGMEDEDYLPALEEYADYLEAERNRLRDALKDIRECAELSSPIALQRIEEIVDTIRREDGE